MPVKKGAVCPKIAALAKSFVQTPRIFLHQFQWTVVGFVTHFLRWMPDQVGHDKTLGKIMTTKGFFNAFADVWMHEGVRTPMVDYCGALGHISPTDLGIKAARLRASTHRQMR